MLRVIESLVEGPAPATRGDLAEIMAFVLPWRAVQTRVSRSPEGLRAGLPQAPRAGRAAAQPGAPVLADELGWGADNS